MTRREAIIVACAVACGTFGGFAGGVEFRRLSAPKFTFVSLSQCMLDEMKGRPGYMLTFAAQVCHDQEVAACGGPGPWSDYCVFQWPGKPVESATKSP